ncbi:MAG: hypothetical protein IPM54_43790 [Polyangiaceae bacterium]|nr:hypothetical protein [Polyangiaceae bacterium]
MYVARWHLTARFGHKDDCLKLLQRWEIDVANRIGWRPGSIRIVAGGIGAGDTDIELEVRIDGLDDLESAWRDMAAVPYQAEYQKQLSELIVAGSSRWTVHQIVDFSTKAS